MPETADIHKIQESIDSLRDGPRPLPVHIGTALAAYMKKNAKAPDRNMMAEMTAMVAGIQKYQEHSFKRSMPALPVVWQQGAVSLLYCAAEKQKKGSRKEGGAAIFLIPSMINKSTIFDLLPHRSFVRWLAGQGFDVYLLDWGHPLEDAALADMNSVIGKRLLPAMTFLREERGAPYHILGYCMGGLLLTAAATLLEEALHSTIRSAVFLASPWDFHAGNRALGDQVRMGTASALQMMEASNSLPVNWVQSVFVTVNADRTVKKFSDFLEIDPDSERAHLFVAVEDWLNDGLDLPGSVARSCILEWYNENRPGKGEWKIMGKTIKPEHINTPSLVVASSHDRLVPCESSLSMARKLPQAETLTPDIGHIGMLSSRRAETEVWIPVAEWLRAQ